MLRYISHCDSLEFVHLLISVLPKKEDRLFMFDHSYFGLGFGVRVIRFDYRKAESTIPLVYVSWVYIDPCY